MAIIQGFELMTMGTGLYLSLLHLKYSEGLVTTISFGSLVLGNQLLIIVSRSRHEHILDISKRSNPARKWIIGTAIILFMGLLLIPFLRERFYRSMIDATGILLILASGLISLIWCELTPSC